MNALRYLGLISLGSALLLLASCASECAPRVIHEKTVEYVPTPVTKPLPVQLTDPLAYPQSDDLTIEGLVTLIVQLYDVIDQANADRVTALTLTTP